MTARPAALADIVIVNYKSYDELGRCLQSLESCRQDLGRVVIVDHESDLQAASRIAAAFPWAEIVERSTNEGFATGINLGVGLTTAPFLLFLNPDCIAERHLVARMVEYLQTRTDAAVLGPRILNSDGTVQGSARRFPGFTTAIAGRSSWLTRRFPRNPLSRYNLPALDGQILPLDVDWVSGACMLVRRTAFDEVNGMDERFFLYWEDADLCKRLAQRGWRTVYFPAVTIAHAGGRSSIHVYRESMAAFHRSAFLLFRKHSSSLLRLSWPFVYVALQLRLRTLLYLHRHRLTSAPREQSAGQPAEAVHGVKATVR